MNEDRKFQSDMTDVHTTGGRDMEQGSYTLFFVTRETRESRSRRIRDFFKVQPVLGYLMAVIDFEWTIRRAIVMMSGCPASVIRERLETRKYSGWGAYKDCWRLCVEETRNDGIPTLEHVVFGDDITAEKQEAIGLAFLLRHKVVHGQASSLPKVKANAGLEVLLVASENIVKFVDGHYGKSMFSRVYNPRARCKSCPRRTRCRFPQERARASALAEERHARDVGRRRAAR